MPKTLELNLPPKELPKARETLKKFLKRGGVWMHPDTRKAMQERQEQLKKEYANVPNGDPVWLAAPFHRGNEPVRILEGPADFILGGRRCVVRICRMGCTSRGQEAVVDDVFYYDKRPGRILGLRMACWPRGRESSEKS